MKAAKRLAGLAVILIAAAAALVFLRPPAASDILLTGAHAGLLDDQGAVAVFLTIENSGGPDTLIGVSSPDATDTSIVGPGNDGFAIPAGSNPALAADGAFLRLADVDGALDEGRLIPITLEFETAGPVSTQARLEGAREAGEAHHFGLFGLGGICIPGEGEPLPAIALDVTPDGDGWRVQVLARQFEFREDLADGLHIPGTGHGHLYIDGLKLGRLYANEAHIAALPPGTHEVQVTLNTNDHRAYVVDEEPVTATATVEVR